MKFAYLILVHQHPEQFIRLVKKLDSQDSLFFVHVDKKADDTGFKEINNHIDPAKIVWLKRRSVVWAGFNSIKVTLDGLKAAAACGNDIGYLTFISGQDYPIKPVKQYQDFLKHSNGQSFMEYSPLPRPNWANGGLDRILYHHILFPSFRLAFPPISYLKAKLEFVDTAKWKLIKKIVSWFPAAKKFPRKFINGYIPYEGSNWFTLSMALVKNILMAIEDDKAFYQFFKYTHHADEIFFQTLVLNKFPEETKNLQNRNVTHVHWDKTTGRPFSLTMDHFEEIKCSDRFFARKFDMRISAELMNKIDNEILK